jgi:hypothetical protein
MDETTLFAHRTAAEQSLYQSLLNGTFGERLRLEQELISFAAVAAAARVVSNDDLREAGH